MIQTLVALFAAVVLLLLCVWVVIELLKAFSTPEPLATIVKVITVIAAVITIIAYWPTLLRLVP